MNCRQVGGLLSMYLDGAVSGRQMRAVEEHLRACASCDREYAMLCATRRLISGLGRQAAPAYLAERLQATIASEIARSSRRHWEGLQVRWQNALNAFMVPVTLGVVSAVAFFGILIGFFAVPQRLQASQSDVPTSLYTAPALRYAPPPEMGNLNADSIVVEAEVAPDGRIQDYRILSAPEDAEAVLPQLKNMLIFTTFNPATAFGQPTSSHVILTFSKVQVKG